MASSSEGAAEADPPEGVASGQREHPQGYIRQDAGAGVEAVEGEDDAVELEDAGEKGVRGAPVEQEAQDQEGSERDETEDWHGWTFVRA